MFVNICVNVCACECMHMDVHMHVCIGVREHVYVYGYACLDLCRSHTLSPPGTNLLVSMLLEILHPL